MKNLERHYRDNLRKDISAIIRSHKFDTQQRISQILFLMEAVYIAGQETALERNPCQEKLPLEGDLAKTT